MCKSCCCVNVWSSTNTVITLPWGCSCPGAVLGNITVCNYCSDWCTNGLGGSFVCWKWSQLTSGGKNTERLGSNISCAHWSLTEKVYISSLVCTVPFWCEPLLNDLIGSNYGRVTVYCSWPPNRVTKTSFGWCLSSCDWRTHLPVLRSHWYNFDTDYRGEFNCWICSRCKWG